MIRATITAATLTILTSCVPYSASTGAKKSGEELSFQASRKRFKVTERQVAGETDHYDSSGNYSGTSQRIKYVNKTKLGPREVRFYQGDREIGEADFYRFGGDIAAAHLAEKRQRKLFWMNTGGWGTSLVAAAGLTAASLGVGGKKGVTGIYISSAVLGAIGSYLLKVTIPARKDARVDLRRASEIGVRF